MKLSLSAYIILFLCTGTSIQHAYAQQETQREADSILNMRMTSLTKADELYFDAIKAKSQNDGERAKALFEQFTTLKPQVSAGYYELSKIYNNEKKLDKAEENIKKALAIDDHNKWYKEEYASILAEQGNYLAAADIIAGLCKTEPDDEEYPKMAADYYERAQKFEEAIKYNDIALLRSGDDEDIYMHKVHLYLEMNKVDKAADVVTQMIGKDQYNGKYYKLLADIYDNNKMMGKATEVYNIAQKLIPDDPSVQLGIAEHYLKMGDTASYIVNVKKVIFNKDLDAQTQLELMGEYLQTMPNDSALRVEGLPIVRQLASQHLTDAQVFSVYGDFLDGNNKEDSAAWAYKRSLEIKPADFNVWKKLFNTYTDSRHADSLIKYTEKAMRLFPNLALVTYYNAIGHFSKKEYAGAIKAIKRAIDQEPETEKAMLADMYALLADIYHANKQDDLSDNAFEQALKLDYDNSSTLNNYSYYLSERGKKLDEAEKMSKRSIEIKPTEATYLDTYGWIQYKKGNYEAAKTFIQRAIDLAGKNADATLYDHLGNVFYKLNDKEKAVQYWKTSKEKGSDDPQIDKKISEGQLYE